MQTTATPLFVLGKHRSGTTWLANLLCEHPAIAGVQHARHNGAHESAYFSVVTGRYGDLSVATNYVEFVEAVGTSDYFRLAGADRAFLYSLWPTTYEVVFRAVMDRFARRHGARYWLEKTPAHSVEVERLARAYPDARFVAIRRPVTEVVASSVGPAGTDGGSGGRRGAPRLARVAEAALSWARYNKTLDAFGARSARLLWVTYGDLRFDVEGPMRRVCRFLGLPFDPGACRSRFAPNSTFSDPRSRARALSGLEARTAAGVAAAARTMPEALLAGATAVRRRLLARRRDLPSWFYAMLDVPWNQTPASGPAASSPERASALLRDGSGRR